jgi:hypothetical protein
MPEDGSPQKWAPLIGAATAVLTITVAVIYGLGAFSLGLKLWLINDPVTPVLGQLPNNFLLIAAFAGVIGPAIIAGAILYLLCAWLAPAIKSLCAPRSLRAYGKRNYSELLWVPIRDSRAEVLWVPIRDSRADLGRCSGRPHDFRILIGKLLLAGALACVPVIFLLITHRFTPGALRPSWEIYLACLFTSMASILLAFYILSKYAEHEATIPDDDKQRTRHKILRAAIGTGAAILAVIPCVAFVSAAVPLPNVALCGPTFNHLDSSGRHYAVGNLIGTSGTWVYIAETHTRLLNGKEVYAGSYIAVVPLSAVEIEAVGQTLECNNVSPQSGSPQTTGTETNPADAADYAEKSVGACLSSAFLKAGYRESFRTYIGGGVVQFQIGTESDPTGNPASWTLIDVLTYANGYVADNSALDHWGCQPADGGLVAGYYVDGKPGTPHWFILLAAGPGGNVSGTIAYLGNDGQASLTQTFSGSASSGLATLTFSQAGLQAAPYKSGSITLGSCAAWLKHILNLAACTFTHSGGPG